MSKFDEPNILALENRLKHAMLNSNISELAPASLEAAGLSRYTL